MAALKRCFTIVLGGTSLTNGRLATDWDKDLRAALAPVSDREVRVINWGKGSQTSTSWGVPTAAAIAALQPDLIVSEGYAINNCAMGVTPAQARANLDTMITTWRTLSPRSRICIQTMSPASSGDAARTTLGDYYADEMAKAVQWGTDSVNNYINWPNPLPVALTQASDGLHPTKAAHRQYSFPTLLAYVTPLILSAPSGL